jgi:hypothetical protein
VLRASASMRGAPIPRHIARTSINDLIKLFIPLIAHGHRTEPKKNNSNGNLKVDERKDIYRISVKVAIENSL